VNDSLKPALPNSIIYFFVVVCIAPAFLHLAGVDFGSAPPNLPLTVADGSQVDKLFVSLQGAFVHSLLEWTAFCIAIFTAVLAINHFMITGDVVTPVIAMALLASGCMDAFHTLAADRLIDTVADNRNLIPFTWAICRVFNSGICLIGICIFLFQKEGNYQAWGKRLVLGMSATVSINLSAASV